MITNCVKLPITARTYSDSTFLLDNDVLRSNWDMPKLHQSLTTYHIINLQINLLMTPEGEKIEKS